MVGKTLYKKLYHNPLVMNRVDLRLMNKTNNPQQNPLSRSALYNQLSLYTPATEPVYRLLVQLAVRIYYYRINCKRRVHPGEGKKSGSP